MIAVERLDARAQGVARRQGFGAHALALGGFFNLALATGHRRADVGRRLFEARRRRRIGRAERAPGLAEARELRSRGRHVAAAHQLFDRRADDGLLVLSGFFGGARGRGRVFDFLQDRPGALGHGLLRRPRLDVRELGDVARGRDDPIERRHRDVPVRARQGGLDQLRAIGDPFGRSRRHRLVRRGPGDGAQRPLVARPGERRGGDRDRGLTLRNGRQPTRVAQQGDRGDRGAFVWRRTRGKRQQTVRGAVARLGVRIPRDDTA